VNLSTRAVATACAAAAIAGGVFLGEWGLLAVLVALVVAFAAGWAPLLGLPAPGGTFFVVALPGLGALAAVHVTTTEPWLRYLPLVLAMGLLLSFTNELLRADGRERLVESLVGGVSGVVVAVSAAGWIAASKVTDGMALVLLCAAALAAASAVSATPRRGAVAVSVGVAAVLPETVPLDGVWAGVVAAILVTSLQMLFHRLPALREPRAALAVIVLPVAMSGVLAYVVGRVLVA
jgi:hypothetical protein